MTAAHLAQSQVTVILPDKIRVQKTVTSIFQDVWVPGTPTGHRPHNFLGTRLWHMGHWMHTFLFSFKKKNSPDRQTQTNARRHKANRRKTGEENKWGGWRRKEQFIIEPPTCTTKMPIPMVPTMCVLSSTHSPLFQNQPGKKKKKKKEQKGEWGCQLRNPPCAGVAEESHRHPGSRFLQDNALPTYEIYPWMNELPGEQMNYPWVMLFICRLMGRMGRCVHTNS